MLGKYTSPFSDANITHSFISLYHRKKLMRSHLLWEIKSIQAKTRVVVQLLGQPKTFFIMVDFLIFDCKKVKLWK